MKIAFSAALVAAYLCSPSLAAPPSPGASRHPLPEGEGRGWSPPSPFTPFTPPNRPPAPAPHHGSVPAPKPAPGTPQEIKGVLDSLLEVQAQFVADVNTADQWASTPAPGVTPAAPIDPLGHACYPALASWAAGLTPPVAPPNGPSGGLVTAFEQARVLNIEAQSVINEIVTTGLFPIALQEACGGLIVSSVTAGGQIVGEVGAFDALLARFIPKAALMKHGVGRLGS